MHTKERITIDVSAKSAKWLRMVSEAAGVSREKIVSSLFARMTYEIAHSEHETETPNPKKAV